MLTTHTHTYTHTAYLSYKLTTEPKGSGELKIEGPMDQSDPQTQSHLLQIMTRSTFGMEMGWEMGMALEFVTNGRSVLGILFGTCILVAR